ncbi:MAG: excinuclease ABC subunit UvrB [Myxococcaceae bacterium]
MSAFEIVSPYKPAGDQPRAISELTQGLRRGDKHQTLLGVTGSGKTFTIANVVAEVQKPTLVIAHNKTLAAQLYGEFKGLFPNNAIEYFVSYFDYYQPEAYVPTSDTYIEKDSTVNEEIERMRHAATRSLNTRSDVLIVASVSCIYGIGMARTYVALAVKAETGQELGRDALLRQLVDAQYERNDLDFHRGTFRVRGDTVEIFPAYEDERAIRIEFFGDTVERIQDFDPLRGVTLGVLEKAAVYPASHYVTEEPQRRRALQTIREELLERLLELRGQNKLVEAQRLEQRTTFDLEMLEQMGFCNGIENYSRHLSGRAPGEAPPCLLDYFPRDFLLVVDESHQTVPQIGAMFRGDRSRKETLVDFGFRLPSALDNRPLKFGEFEQMVHQSIYVSATPAEYELQKSSGVVVEQLIRPTGLLDPEVEVRPARTQVEDLLEEIRQRVARKERTLVTVLTKRMAEDLTEYLADVGLKVQYLHADIDAIERTVIIRDLRRGQYDVLVGINLLREGLDIPETSLVAVLDADKEGFLRSKVSLIQTMGRAARNLHGRVILYADRVTASMQAALEETERRRETQARHNAAHGITPESVKKGISDLSLGYSAEPAALPLAAEGEDVIAHDELRMLIADSETAMRAAADTLDFERAAALRDQLATLRDMELGLRPASRLVLSEVERAPAGRARAGRGARRMRRRR